MVSYSAGSGYTAGEDYQYGGSLENGIATHTDLRRLVGSSNLTSGNVMFTFFRSPKTFTARQMRMVSGTIAAAATPTLCRMGVYRVINGNSDVELLGAADNDTSLFSVASTIYTRNLTTPVSLVKGLWYATALLIVSPVAMPNALGSGGTFNVTNRPPRMSGTKTGQADLESAFTTIGDTGGSFYAELLP